MKLDQTLHKKVVIVTGSNGLLGSFFCEHILSLGACVYGFDRDKNLNSIENPSFKFLQVDITNSLDIEKARDTINQKYGRIDVIINNAAINDSVEGEKLDLDNSRFENFPLELWEKSLDVNLTGPFLICQIMLELLEKSSSASIINISSTYGLVAPDQDIYRDFENRQFFFKGPAYSTTKGGLIMFTKFLGSYLGPRGIRVNALCPGGVENGQDEHFIKNYSSKTCLGRMANAEDYAGAIEFLASDKSSYMTGSVLCVDGGWTAK